MTNNEIINLVARNAGVLRFALMKNGFSGPGAEACVAAMFKSNLIPGSEDWSN